MLRRSGWNARWTFGKPHYLLIALTVFLTIGSVVTFVWWRLGGPLQGPVSHVDAAILAVGMTGNGPWQTPLLKLQLPSGETVYLRMRSFQPVYTGEIVPVNVYMTATGQRRGLRLAFEDIDYAPIDPSKQRVPASK